MTKTNDAGGSEAATEGRAEHTEHTRRTRGARLPSATDATAEARDRRREILAEAGLSATRLSEIDDDVATDELAGNIEGFLGFARVPVGVFGPLSIRGEEANGDFFVPIATTEGALVMSYQHVANVVSRAGGIVTSSTAGCVERVPGFVFESLTDAVAFARWLPSCRAALEEVVANGSRFCRLTELEATVVGREVYVRMGFATGDAAGQNMVTIAAAAACTRLLDEAPFKPCHWQLESNLSGDKKPTVLALQGQRGKRAMAELVLSEKLCSRYFRTGVAQMLEVWGIATTGAIQNGTIGSQGNYANALAGLFIACGQDVACVAEATVGITRFKAGADGELVLTVTLPNLIVGTVGGGTFLPTARECLDLLDCRGDGRARKFAEIVAAVALAGELALVGAMAAGSFAQAHATRGRSDRSK